jgi:hypothetical protein
MGKKVFKTVLKVAAVAAIAYFAPVIAAPLLKTVGVSGALASTVGSAAVGAGLGELSGVGWRQGALAGGLAGAGKTGLFGGTAKGATAAGGAGGTAGTAGTAGTTAAGAGGFTGAGGALAGSVQGAGTMGAAGLKLAGLTPGVTAAAAPQTLGGALSAAASNPVSALGQGIGNIAGGVSAGLSALGTAAGLAPGALGQVAPQLLAASLVGGRAGRALAANQEAELQRAQQYNAALTQQRLDQANRLIGEADYFDPEYMGRQAAEAAMIRGGIQETEGTRGLTGERRAAEQRRYRLGTARTAGAAYQQGYGTGAEMRTRTRLAGIQSMPSEFPTTNAQSALLAREVASQGRANRVRNLNILFDEALGRTGPSDEETMAANPGTS